MLPTLILLETYCLRDKKKKKKKLKVLKRIVTKIETNNKSRTTNNKNKIK